MGFKAEFDRIARDEARSAAARNILNEVEDWSVANRAVASRRWVWELVQNAKDAAKGKAFTFSIALQGDTLTVRHDAGPFKLRDIVALVEGDSSKHRRAEDTTGKFGKGFLVSHVVSTNVNVSGILSDETEGNFSFAFRLDRSGSEDDIRRNIDTCRDYLEEVKRYVGDGYPTEFVYHLRAQRDTQDSIDNALRDLRNHAPYLFAFIPELARITVDLPGPQRLVFATSTRENIDANHLAARVSKVTVSQPDGTRTVLVFTARDAHDGARPQIAFQLSGDNRIATPSVVARVFQDLPLYGTVAFDLPIVLNLPGNTDVDSDRACPTVAKPDTHKAIGTALLLLPEIAEWATAHQIRGVHLLAEFGISAEMQKEPQNAELWEKLIAETVKGLAKRKLVECQDGLLPVDDVTFPEATWLENVSEDLALLQGVQRLLSSRQGNIPSPESAEEWIAILAKWKTIRDAPHVRRTGLVTLFSELQNAQTLAGFRKRHPIFDTDDAAIAYLSALFQQAADYCDRQKVGAPADMNRQPIVLNQNGKFREGRELKLDGGIDEVLKDVSKQLRLDFKEALVYLTFSNSAGSTLISQLCGDNTFSVDDAVGRLTAEMQLRFSSVGTRGIDADALSNVALVLMVWFAAHPSDAPADLRSFPFLTVDGKLHAFSEHHDTFIVPPALLSEEDRPWVNLFPKSLRLSDRYLRSCESLQVSPEALVSFLTERHLACSHLIVRRDLSSDAEYFSEMYADKSESGHRIESVYSTDIAGFTRLLNETTGASSSGDWERAKEVLSFILSFATMKDDSWRSSLLSACNRSHGCVGTVKIVPCAWLAKLKHQHWVPNFEPGRPCEPLSSRNIQELWQRLAPETSQSPGARDFLAMHFGVDRLDMAIRSSAGDDAVKRAMLRDELAAVVDTGIDPLELRDLVVRRRSVQEISTRNGRLGRIVETLVSKAFERDGFEVMRTGVGSDFKVWPAEAKDLEWDKQDIGELRLTAAYNGVPVEFLIEVKATRGDAVRVSWRQAETATDNPTAYVLCVVDFSAHPDLFERVLAEDEPTCDLIDGCLSLVPTIAQNLATSVANLNSAMETNDPGVEVEKGDEIRFRISQGLWQRGRKLGEWATDVRDALSRQARPLQDV